MKLPVVAHRLDFKLILGLILSLLVVGLPFFVYFYDFHKEQLMTGLRASTTNLSKMVVGTLQTAMLVEEPHTLVDEINRLSGQAAVERIMILNKKGELRVSSDQSMIGQVFNFNTDPICTVCHQHSPAARKNTAIVTDSNGVAWFRNMNLIYNQPRCYGCHDMEDRINGVLVMDLSMKEVQAQLHSSNKQMFGMALIMMLVTSAVLGLLVHRLILRRIRSFTDITMRLQAGNIDEVIHFREKDEISKLADSFNAMTGRLKLSLREVERNKEYLEHILNGIDDEIVVVDREFKIVTANEAYFRNAFEDKEQIMGRTCMSIAHGAEKECALDTHKGCPARATFKLGTLQKTMQTYTDKFGKERHVEIYCSPLRDEDGTVFQVIELRRDITERRSVEEQLIHTEKLTSVGRLAAGVAHEINNPLDGIMNCLTIIQKNPDEPEKVATMLELISEGIERIGLIVRRLLIFSTHRRLKLEMTSVNKVLEQSLLLVNHRIEEEGIALRLSLYDQLPLVSSDPHDLSQVFVNVLINAIDVLDGHVGGRITIKTELHHEDSSVFVCVRITDNGHGISSEDREKIFSPFFTTKEVEKGTGLGLSISKKIIEEHGGRITVDSELQAGTTVSIFLPGNAVTDHRADVTESPS
jgi:PAS domain S-box-containing protein